MGGSDPSGFCTFAPDADDCAAAQKVLDQLLPRLRALTDETGVDIARYDVLCMRCRPPG